MESDKIEAIEAKQIAEKKFTTTGDLIGAKEFALKAKSLDPSLNDIACLIETLDVYISASKRINGEVNWYGILGVEPTANYDTIWKTYRRLALALHPDNNKSVGADGAFKLLSEAWSVLSNPIKRLAYDQKCKIQPGSPGIPISFHDFMGVMSSSSRIKNKIGFPSSSSAPPKQDKTFWTLCLSCSMKYEYLKDYCNCELLCPHCYKSFKAIEVPSPSMNGNGSWNSRRQQLRRANQSTMPTKTNVSQGQSSIFSPVNFSQSGDKANTATQPSSISRGLFDQLRRIGEDIQKQTKQVDVNTSNLDIFRARRCESSKDQQTQTKKVSVKIGKPNMPGIKRRDCPNCLMLPTKVRATLVGKAKRAIGQRCKEYDFVNLCNVSAEATKFADTKTKMTTKKETIAMNKRQYSADKRLRRIDINTKVSKSSVPSSANDPVMVEDPNAVTTMSVPDPDFYNFDKDRTEASFKENQVWAAYDDNDGMPRYYAMIHSVAFRKPFKVSISWLNSKSNDELGLMNCNGSRFHKTIGNFWIGKRMYNSCLNSFSHKVEWTKGTKGVMQIYPKKGDVWAIYRNWSPDWNNLTPDEIIRKYDMVEVLEDFDEERGVTVSPLVKVAGFKTIFRRHPKSSIVLTFQKKEIFRFSHQVASHLLTGQEANNAPKGCLELDPAAIPMELLHVLTKEEVGEMENIFEKIKEELEKKSKEDSPMEHQNVSSEKNIAEETMKKVEEDKTTKKRKERTEETDVQDRNAFL